MTHEDTKGVLGPIFIGYAEDDQMVSPTLIQDLNGWLSASGASFETRVYPEMKHGFAARPDTDDPGIKKQSIQAFEDSTEFLRMHL